LLCINGIYWFVNKTGYTSNFYSYRKHIYVSEGVYRSDLINEYGFGAYEMYHYKDNEYYYISKTPGFIKVVNKKDTVIFTLLNNERFSGLAYDSLRNIYWAYNSEKVLGFRNDSCVVNLTNTDLHKLGINNIEKILVDNKYGKTFIKETGKLWQIDTKTFAVNQLYPEYNLGDAKVYISNHTLITAGVFGILFSKVNSDIVNQPPYLYSNTKNNIYKTIQTELDIEGNEILLETDNDWLSISIPSDSEIIHTPQDAINKYKIFVTNENLIFDLQQKDSINIDQKNNNLQFDVINPDGNGKLRYLYKIGQDSTWHEMNNNQLLLPALSPGMYHSLSVIAFDDAWRSKEIKTVLYIIPYWWQKPTVVNIIIVSAIVCFLLIILLIISVTRKIVLKSQTKKSYQQDLELKAIYAQINPHFIFNSLTTSLFLIKSKKLEEAYTHIQKFSKLLRSYIKSSRNRFVTLEEEIVNLQNYIELQQNRFHERFDYSIIKDKTLPTGIQIPSLLLQPFVENAINHGLLPQKKHGQLLIEFKPGHTQNEIVCTIEDNGIGRKKSKYIQDSIINDIKEDSYGTELIDNLVTIFNKFENTEIHISYTDKEEPDTGTIVELRIKYQQHGSTV